jgi:phage shock protein C
MGGTMGETTGGVLRRGSDRILGGVCSGLAAYFGLDVLLVRVVFVIIGVAPPGVGIILYLVLWFLMEPPPGIAACASRNIGDRLRAMGDEIRDDFRSGFFRSSGVTAASGSEASSAAPAPGTLSHSTTATIGGRSRGFWAGVILIALGAYFLIDNLGLLRGFRWELVGPVVLIAIGLLVLVRRR